MLWIIIFLRRIMDKTLYVFCSLIGILLVFECNQFVVLCFSREPWNVKMSQESKFALDRTRVQHQTAREPVKKMLRKIYQEFVLSASRECEPFRYGIAQWSRWASHRLVEAFGRAPGVNRPVRLIFGRRVKIVPKRLRNDARTVAFKCPLQGSTFVGQMKTVISRHRHACGARVSR